MNENQDSGTILERLSALQDLSIAQLREEFEKHFGKPCLSRNKRQLIKRISERIQSQAAGDNPGSPIPGPVLTVKYEPKRKGRSKRVAKTEKATAEKKAKAKPVGERDKRLPKPGTLLLREWHSKRYTVTVEQDGFTYAGRRFRSLSAVAKAICNQIVNGYAWFKLGPKEPQKS